MLPYEELLCKETTLVANEFTMSDHEDITLTGDTHIQSCMKVPFVQLMRFQHRVRWSLMKMGARTHYKADIDTTVLCGICKRDCYVAHIMCNCRADAICLCHGNAFYHFFFTRGNMPFITYCRYPLLRSSCLLGPCLDPKTQNTKFV